MRRKRLLIAGLALAAAIVAVAVVWLGNQSPLERYTTPPLAGTKYRISLLVPRGWTPDKEIDASRGSIHLRPSEPPAWIPRWLRWGPFKEAEPYSQLVVYFAPGAMLFDKGIIPEPEEQTPILDNDYRRNLKHGAGSYGAVYYRSRQQDFDTTYEAIYSSLRLVD